MKKNFSIHYKESDIMIETLPADEQGNVYYMVQLPGEALTLEYTEDDEGAGHWLEKKSNHETEVSAAIGHLIELHHMQHPGNA